ncbi:FAD binding domain [Seminavis robusta]|uniref:FAD binding domain n=1 Tax=Seminavis robusta TaxID=568900 RepID=A0A9N8HME1_9STRA|nr:FAD binding domain [Seminavis robusta]|eukprot:Sro899_g217710.1 FAD binding domain (824) ;mRNA; f:4187-6658
MRYRSSSCVAWILCILCIPLLWVPWTCQAFLPVPYTYTTRTSASDQRISHQCKTPPTVFALKDPSSSSSDSSSTSKSASTRRKKKSQKRRQPKKKKKTTVETIARRKRDPNGIETWRVFGIEVHPDAYCTEAQNYGTATINTSTVNNHNNHDNATIPVDKLFLTPPIIQALLDRLDLTINNKKKKDQDQQQQQYPSSTIRDIRVVRRSLDARKKRRGGQGEGGPRYVFVLDVDIHASYTKYFQEQSGRLEFMSSSFTSADDNNDATNTPPPPKNDDNSRNPATTIKNKKKRVIIVGAGPAGLFCALTLVKNGVTPIVLERGLPVESRGKSIGALIHRSQMDQESNFAFGEGGAGTWSDGKLTTRIGRNSHNVRTVLETFVQYGAPETILVHGSPHLGTDNLVKLLRAMRLDLRRMGGEIVFGAKMTELIVDHQEEGVTKGVKCTKSGEAMERHVNQDSSSSSSSSSFYPEWLQNDSGEDKTTTIMGDAVVLATGHSARDVYEKLHQDGVKLEAKGFAVGFRVEHPQKIINKIQYGNEWGMSVITGKKTTDAENDNYFMANNNNDDAQRRQHPGQLPVPSYRLATNHAKDGTTDNDSNGNNNHNERGVYSFCMCPGGQIVPASTDPNEVCVNGMSFSRRDSTFANSALVVTVDPEDAILDEYRQDHGVLAGVAFQRDMERRASLLGGGNLTVPVQRVTDFLAGTASTSAPPSSYRLGVKPAACHEIYPPPLVNSLRDALEHHFERQMPGFVCEDALLHAVETRTSSPVRVSRNAETLEAEGTKQLYPAGEGAGFAGGIVSAAVDGICVANAILERVLASSESDN